MSQPTRRLVACLAILVVLGVWVWGAATLAGYIADWPKWASRLYFILAGFGWILPLRPVFKWMNSGVTTD